MDRAEILNRFYLQNEEGKDMLLEKLVFCEFSDEHDFENYFRVEELKESELFCLISFLYQQDCFLMMLDILNRYKEKFISSDMSIIKEVDFSEKFVSRMVKLDNFEKVKAN